MTPQPPWQQIYQPAPALVPARAAHATARRLRIQQFTPLLGALSASLVVALTMVMVFLGVMGLILSMISAAITDETGYGQALAFALGTFAGLAIVTSLYAATLRYLGARWPWLTAFGTTVWGALLVAPMFLMTTLGDLFIAYLLVVTVASGVPMLLMLQLRAARRTA